ncbi:MAG: hypothetical protein IPM50_14135 [Acidobacteriota bacterium]|nr:MAG: hypothetical protein IPM50_14135 [Acidobacteriota bacterium]
MGSRFLENGNVTKKMIAVGQRYQYDSLNRLRSAVENVTPNSGSQSQSWKQTYTFDRYGNRRFDFTSGNTTFPDPNCPEAICNPTVSTSNNRLTSTGWSYDSAGNTTNDPQGRTFIYDAENKQTEVRDQYNTVIGQYFYDGDGKRVKKYVPSTGETTVFVYDALGKLVAEYSTVVESVENAKVAYLTADHLGSPRINTDRDGNVTSRRDFMPFGEQIYTSQRTMELGYDSDTVRRNFTTYERDQETDLDFAKARMYRSDLGRFSSPDYFAYNTSIAAPQSWNLYQYARNNPVLYKDPGGKDLYINIGGKDYKVARSDQAFVLVGNDGSDSDVVSAQSMVYRMAERYRREINELINNPSTTRISIGFTDEKWNVGSIRGPNPTQSANEDGDIVNLLNIQATLSLYRGDADGSFVIFATETLLAHLLTRENMFSATTGQLADGSLDRGALMNDGSMPVRHDELFRGFEVVVREAYRLPLIEPFTRFATEVRVVESFTDRYVPFDASPGPAGHLGQPARPDRQVSAGPCYGLSGAVIPCN